MGAQDASRGPKKQGKGSESDDLASNIRSPDTSSIISQKSHHDLPSFLQYAQESKLSTKSTVYVGTHYEYTVLESLKRLGFSLQRTAGRGDQGIDLLGHWTTPSSPVPLRVLMQCKALSRSLSPDRIRELEGAFIGAPAGWKGDGVLGFMVATKEATLGVREALQRSRWPIGYVMLDKSGDVKQLIWNHVAQGSGLEGLGVGTKFVEQVEADDLGAVKEEVTLMWQGQIVDSMIH